MHALEYRFAPLFSAESRIGIGNGVVPSLTASIRRELKVREQHALKRRQIVEEPLGGFCTRA